MGAFLWLFMVVLCFSSFLINFVQLAIKVSLSEIPLERISICSQLSSWAEKRVCTVLQEETRFGCLLSAEEIDQLVEEDAIRQ